MAVEFKVSLLNENDEIGVIQNGNTLIIKDYSNYVANTDYDAYYEFFSVFKKIIVKPFNGTEYVYSTLAGGNVLINTPLVDINNGEQPIIQEHTITEGTVFEIGLYAIPSVVDESVGKDNYIEFNGRIYLALDDTTGSPTDQPTQYTDLGLATDFDVTTLPDKYKSEVSVYINQLSEDIATKSLEVLGCEILNGLSQCSDLCNNVNIHNVMNNELTYFANKLLDATEYEKANEVINYNSFLNKCKCQ